METEEVKIGEKEAPIVKSGETEELWFWEDTQSTALDRTKRFEIFLFLYKLNLNNLPRALETTNDEEVARKIQAEWDAEEERKRFEELKKTKPKTTFEETSSLAQKEIK
ncbi:hypothetical protein Tco_1037755 [Tanacetum coccineum]